MLFRPLVLSYPHVYTASEDSQVSYNFTRRTIISCQIHSCFTSPFNHRNYTTRCVYSAAIAETVHTTTISSQHAPTATTTFAVFARLQQNTTTTAPLPQPRLRTAMLRPLPLTLVRPGSRASIKTPQQPTSVHAFQRSTAVATPRIRITPYCDGSVANVMGRTALLGTRAVHFAATTGGVNAAASTIVNRSRGLRAD